MEESRDGCSRDGMVLDPYELACRDYGGSPGAPLGATNVRGELARSFPGKVVDTAVRSEGLC